MAETKYKLFYFPVAGKGECLRLAFHYLGVPFEDYRFASYEEFAEMKASLMFGQVPALEVTIGEEKALLTQSLSILRFIGKLKPEKGLYPSDPVAAAKVDAIADQEADAFMGFRITRYKQRFGFGFFNEEKHKNLLDETVEACNKEIIPGHLATLAKQLELGGTGWLAGTKNPTIADFFWAPVLDQLREGWTGNEKILDQFPALCELHKKFFSLPEIVDYYQKNKKK